jgi:hypothetical protein
MSAPALPFKKHKSGAPAADAAPKRSKTTCTAAALLAPHARATAPATLDDDWTIPLLDLGELVPATLLARPRCACAQLPQPHCHRCRDACAR